jgi:hypothetical protein
VKEQSHKDEMSKALRGDFERLRGRGVATTLGPRDAPPPDPEPDVERVAEPPPAPSEPVVSAAPEPVPEPEPGWVGRLFGRR